MNQVSDEKILEAEKTKNYEQIVKKIVSKNKGLFFVNEMFVIEKK